MWLLTFLCLPVTPRLHFRKLEDASDLLPLAVPSSRDSDPEASRDIPITCTCMGEGGDMGGEWRGGGGGEEMKKREGSEKGEDGKGNGMPEKKSQVEGKRNSVLYTCTQSTGVHCVCVQWDIRQQTGCGHSLYIHVYTYTCIINSYLHVHVQ